MNDLKRQEVSLFVMFRNLKYASVYFFTFLIYCEDFFLVEYYFKELLTISSNRNGN